MRDKSIPLSMRNLLNGCIIYKQENLEQIHQYRRKFNRIKMDDMICNANVYSAFLEGKATKDEMSIILKNMMRDSRLMMRLNLAATVSGLSVKEKR